MGYITIENLPDAGTLLETDYFLVSNSQSSYKVTLDSLNQILVTLNSATQREFTHVTITSPTNNISSNTSHTVGIASQNIIKSAPCIIEGDTISNTIQISMATNADVIQGFAGDTVNTGEEVIVLSKGIIDYDLTGFPNGGAVYWQLQTLTSNPDFNLPKQLIGYILLNGPSGKLLLSDLRRESPASEIVYFNQNSNLGGSDLQSAIDEIVTRLITLENKLIVSNTPPLGLPGGTWYNTADNTFNIYRESTPGIFSWVPLLFKLNDILDGGTW